MGKSFAVIRTQYIYLNSANRNPSDTSYNFSLSIPHGVFHCEDPSQSFKLSIQNFNAVASWYYVNSTNNQFKIVRNTNFYTITIPVGNYPFKTLASTLTTQINSVLGASTCTVTWNSVTNKFEFAFVSDGNIYQINFFTLDSTSAHYILGFNIKDGTRYASYDMDANRKIISIYTLQTTLSENICVTIDNLTPSKDCTSVENKDSEVCVPSQNVLSIANNFAPNDIITYVQQGGDLFPLYVKDKTIENLEFSVRDENGNLMTYFTDWRASIKVETLQADDSYSDSQQMLQSLTEIKDYLKYIFVSNHLNS